MRPLTKTFVILLVCACGQFTLAQNNQTLLWRISGKGLTKPSYLYGTFHLNDKRLFKFDDSVYAAIAATGGFANELDMNELMAYYVNKGIDEAMDEDKVKDMFTEEERRRLQKPLEKKYKKPFDQISKKDVVKERNKWMSDAFEKGEMPTFVDAYLYDVAMRQGKWLGGIEDMEDQLSLVDKSDVNLQLAETETSTLDQMITLYETQDIDGINRMVNSVSDSVTRDEVLIRRNVKMARRMDSLSAQRTMFFAIGAAHLPGDSGVINQLRARGFTVEPVHSRNRIFAKDYVLKDAPAPWFDVTDEHALYKVAMPGRPSAIEVMGVVEAKFALDCSNLSGYCTMAIVTPSLGRSNDTIFHDLISRIAQRDDIEPKKKVTKGADTGVEYIWRSDNKYWARLQLFHSDNIVYMAAIYASKEEFLMTPKAAHFFSSLVLTPHADSDRHLHTYIDSIFGFTYASPVSITYNDVLTKRYQDKNDWDINAYTGQDMTTGAFLAVITKQPGAGNVIANDSVMLQEAYDLMSPNYKMEPQWGVMDGYRTLLLDGDATDDNLHLKMLNIIRGNRYIAVMKVTNKKAEDASLESLFSSLRLLPYKKVAWQRYNDAGHTFSTIAPSPLRIYPVYKFIPNGEKYFCSYDTMSAMNYSISSDTLSKYEWTSDATTYLKKKMKLFLRESDTIMQGSETINGSDKGYEAFIWRQHSNVHKRIRLVLHGDIVYVLSTTGEKALAWGREPGQFFSAFKATMPVTFNIRESKYSLLLSDLKSTDSATVAAANKALRSSTPDIADLPAVLNALLGSYPRVSRWQDGYAVNINLAYAAGSTRSPECIAFARKNYSLLTGSQKKLKYALLYMLAEMKTPDSYNALAELLASAVPDTDADYRLAYLMTDSLPLLHAILPTLTKVAADTNVGPMIAGFAIALLDSGYIRSDDLAPYAAGFVSLAEKLFPHYQYGDLYDGDIIKMLKLLGVINTPASVACVQKYLAVHDPLLRKTVVLTLINSGHEVNIATMESIAANAPTRVRLYDDLKAAGKEKYFPKKYLHQSSLAEGRLFDAIADDAPSEPTMQFISKKKVGAGSDARIYYLYKVSFKDSTGIKSYLGVSGAYSLADTALCPAIYQAGIYWGDSYDAAHLDDQFQEFIDKHKEYSDD